jgi:aryl-alcohol dehydrogenase-like predicted oxidoreductase
MTQGAAAAGTVTIGGDLVVNRLGFGAMRITGPGIWGPPADHDRAIAVLRRAVDRGVNFIDTADSYGPEVSEQLIAEALHPYPDDLVIATKGGFLRDGPNRWRPDGRPEHLRTALEGSLKRLRLEQIPLHQFHTPDPGVPFDESVGALVELQREGKIHHIGLSNVDADQVRQAMEHTPIASVQNRYNTSDRHSEAVIDLADELADDEGDGFAFIPWAPVGGHTPGEGAALAEVAARHGATPVQIAIAWQLARSPRMLPIPGTGDPDHLDENVAAAAIELTPEDLDQLATPPSSRRSTARRIASRLKRAIR